MIERIGGVDLIIFDNIMSLLAGNMKETEQWAATLSWVRSLTRRKIGQMWMHHTNDEGKGYGDKTREWQMDTVLHLEAAKRPDTDVSFNLDFCKARERTPQTRDEFQTTRVALLGDAWQSEATAIRKAHVSPVGLKFLSALQNVLASGAEQINGRPSTNVGLWRTECTRMGLIDPAEKPKSASALFSKHRTELIAANHVACDNDLVWLVR